LFDLRFIKGDDAMSENKIKVQVLEGTDNKLDLAKLEDVLIRSLIIPSYQRHYAWEKGDIEEIFQTISPDKEEDIYFFGSIILSKKNNGGPGQEKYYIIDGQQRLTSFLLILRVFLDSLDNLFKEINNISNNNKEKLLRAKFELEKKEKNLKNIISQVSLRREQSENSHTDESHILKFIKHGGKPNLSLSEKIDIICKCCGEHFGIDLKREQFDINNTEDFLNYTKKFSKSLEFILNKIKFCLICIEGEDSENFAVNLFNTLNTTGQPLTAFEVLKSELYTIDEDLSKKINELENKIKQKYKDKRKGIILHTGNLLLYLPLYRGDFDEKNYILSDKKFKDQRRYLKQVLNPDSAVQLVKDIENINGFYSDKWLNLDSLNWLKNNDEQVCFKFLSELKHDRVLPIIARFYYNQKESVGQCIKICTAFSSLWRAFHDGGTSGIDKAYKDISLQLQTPEIKNLNQQLKDLFFKKLDCEKLQELKEKWLQKMKTSTIYKNQKLSKLLLFIAYNQRCFNENNKSLTKGKGIDIFNDHYWNHSDYKTIEHILPQSKKELIAHIHTIGNLTLLPKSLNTSVTNKPFLEKLTQFKSFCSKESDDKYPYLPIIKHITSYDTFAETEIEERSQILSEFIWETLAEDWLGWKG